MAVRGTVWTIGHWTCPQEVVLETLATASIDVLADVRKLPGSRRSPQFDAEEMTGWLGEAGIEYLRIAELTGRPVPESVALFPPFYSEFGKNLVLGRDVFINLGCRFQDTGGIRIGDGSLVGHGSTLTTLDHSVDPDRRADMMPAPISIGRKVWLGAGVTVSLIGRDPAVLDELARAVARDTGGVLVDSDDAATPSP